MANEKLTYRAGDISLNACVLISGQDELADIKRLVIEFNVFYDLFSSGINLQLVIGDSIGLIDSFPIVGDETVLLSFKTPTLEKKSGVKFKDDLKFAFHIYKLTDRNRSSHRFETYTLHGISHEVISNERKSVSKSYKDLPMRDIVADVYNNYLRPTNEEYRAYKSNKELNLQETKNTGYFAFTGNSPLKIINFLASESESLENTKSSNFVFFENNEGFNFVTLDSLLNADPVEDMYYAFSKVEKDTTKDVIVGEEQTITSISFKNQFNVLENLQGGLYEHNVETLDPIRKIFKVDTFSYENNFNDIAHITPNKIYTGNSLFKKTGESSVSYNLISNIADDGVSYKESSEYFKLNDAISRDLQLRNPKVAHEFFKYNMASRLQLFNIALEIVVPGNSDIDVGKSVNIHVGQASQFKDLKEQLSILFGEEGNNKFLITAVRHVYNTVDNNFFTVFECVKDTYGNNPEGTLRKTVSKELAELIL